MWLWDIQILRHSGIGYKNKQMIQDFETLLVLQIIKTPRQLNAKKEKVSETH